MSRGEAQQIDDAALERVAHTARGHAHAPYSRFAVGAALRTTDGEIVAGCNVENASLSLGLCAERVAVFAALARGLTPGDRMVIVTAGNDPTPPCGACREVLRRLAPDAQVVSIGREGRRRAWTPGALLPPAAPAATISAMPASEIIARKRDGQRLAPEAIRQFVRGLVSGEIETYQATAFMMAVFWRGMDAAEIRELTAAMVASGARLAPCGAEPPCVDKHSTGGVGDKVSLPLMPLVIAAGLRVPMISGRGLGHTGGTLDKLETIPGYRTALPIPELQELVRSGGGFIAGQTAELVPADRILYALRDVSATVGSVPLIVSSILSKKLAAGLNGLVLDVKFGHGAFMTDRASAEELARALVTVSSDLGLPALALLTRMDAPIGRTVGNALEMRESLEFLHESEPATDLAELVRGLGGLMLALAGRAPTMAAGAELIERQRRNGAGRAAARRWIVAQGGDPAVVDDPTRLVVSAHTHVVRAERGGYVQQIDARLAGEICLQLGGGRRRVGSAIDGSVGLRFHRPCGAAVSRGDPLFTIHLPAAGEGAAPEAADLVRIGSEAPPERPRIAALVTPTAVHENPWEVPIAPAARRA